MNFLEAILSANFAELDRNIQIFYSKVDTKNPPCMFVDITVDPPVMVDVNDERVKGCETYLRRTKQNGILEADPFMAALLLNNVSFNYLIDKYSIWTQYICNVRMIVGKTRSYYFDSDNTCDFVIAHQESILKCIRLGTGFRWNNPTILMPACYMQPLKDTSQAIFKQLITTAVLIQLKNPVHEYGRKELISLMCNQDNACLIPLMMPILSEEQFTTEELAAVHFNMGLCKQKPEGQAWWKEWESLYPILKDKCISGKAPRKSAKNSNLMSLQVSLFFSCQLIPLASSLEEYQQTLARKYFQEKISEEKPENLTQDYFENLITEALKADTISPAERKTLADLWPTSQFTEKLLELLDNCEVEHYSNLSNILKNNEALALLNQIKAHGQTPKNVVKAIDAALSASNLMVLLCRESNSPARFFHHARGDVVERVEDKEPGVAVENKY